MCVLSRWLKEKVQVTVTKQTSHKGGDRFTAECRSEGLLKKGRAGGFQGEHEKAVQQKNRDTTFRSDGQSQSEHTCQLLFQ